MVADWSLISDPSPSSLPARLLGPAALELHRAEGLAADRNPLTLRKTARWPETAFVNMRSITAISSVQHALDLGPAFGAASCLALDSDAGVVYVAGEGLEVACFGGQDGQVGCSIAS